MMRSIALCFAIGVLSACSSSSTGSNTVDGSAPGPTPEGSFSVSFGQIVVPAGQERTQCVIKRLGNPNKMHVGSVHNTLAQGSHHLIVYEVTDTEERTTPYDCRPFADTFDPSKGAPLMITQKKDDLLTLPDGVAYSLDANQMIRLEMHYINPTAKDETVDATTTMIPIDDAAFKYEADFLLVGDLQINIPPQASATLGPTYLALPSAYDGVSFFAITGHEHQYGTNVKVSTATGASDQGSPVYDVPGWQWNEPKTLFTAPPFTVPSGGGFKLTCEWHNTTDKPVTFGESAEQEMCFFWAYYYPRKAGGSRLIIQK
jgi:hypothetical protein